MYPTQQKGDSTLAQRNFLHATKPFQRSQFQFNKTLFFCLILGFFCLSSAWLPHEGISYAAPEKTVKSAEPLDSKRLEGRWLRPDGGYVLQLKDIKKDGSLTATYLNPKPINVSKAQVDRKDDKLTLFVELRDVNYPGSTYTLDYDSDTDRLKGSYFQAALNQTYEVEFERIK